MTSSGDRPPPAVRGVFDPTIGGFQPPELQDGGNPNRVRLLAHAAGTLACVGQCLEPELDQTAYQPATTLSGTCLRIDTRQEGVTALADLSGQWPLYYAARDNQVHYSSDAEDLARDIGDQIDPITLAYYIIGGEFIDPERTVFTHIRRLPAGHALRLSRTGTSVDEYAPLVPDASVDAAETAEALRMRLTEAVSRWPGEEAAQYYSFSGGYDSTSLAFLKASLLPSGELLQAFHTQRLASLSGDTAFALSFAALNPQIDLMHMIIPDDILPYNDLSELDSQYPFSQVEGVVRQTVAYELGRLAERGASVQITGEGGDALFAAPPQYMADLMDHPYKNAVRLFREGTLLAHEGEVAFTGLLKAMRAQSGFSYPSALRSIAAALAHGTSDGQLTWHRITAEAVPLLTNGMRAQLAELTYAKSQQVAAKPSGGIADFVALNDMRLSGRFTANLRRFADKYHIATRAPFLDDPVVAARFRLQTHLTADPAQFKSLLRTSLGQTIPHEVFSRRGKGSYSREVYQGIRANAQTLRTLLGRDSCLAALGVVEPVALLQLITKAELGQAIPLDALERAVSVELWLRQQLGGSSLELPAGAVQPQVERPMGPPVVPSQSLPQAVRVPPHICMAETDVGIAAFNLKTNVVHNLHTKAATVVKALQRSGAVADAAAALRTLYPAVDAALLSRDLTGIMTNLLANDTIEAGDFEPFTIRPAQPRINDAAGDMRMIRGTVDRTGVRLGDYVRMGRALLHTGKLAKRHNLYDTLQVLEARKRNLPPADRASIRRHLVAGHVLARFSLTRAIKCTDLAVATVLAEARRGRAAEYILAMVPDPNYYHAAPGVNGVPVQTPQGRIMEGNFTTLGIF